MAIKIITINNLKYKNTFISLKSFSLFVAVCLSFFATITNVLHAEDTPDNISNKQLDSLYISETEDVKGTLKILHAEPFILI